MSFLHNFSAKHSFNTIFNQSPTQGQMYNDIDQLLKRHKPQDIIKKKPEVLLDVISQELIPNQEVREIVQETGKHAVKYANEMSSSYYHLNIKNNQGSQFHAQQNTPEFVSHKAFKAGSSYFNFRQQSMIQSYPRQILITPQTMHYHPFQSGSYIEFKIPQFNGLINEFYLALDIKNENTTSSLILPSKLCYLIQKVSINKGVQDIQSINSDMIALHNINDLTYENKNINYQLLGIRENKTENVVAAGATKSLLIRIPTCFSRTYSYRKNVSLDELSIKIYFRPGIVSSGSVSNTEVKLQRSDLYLQYVEVTDQQSQALSKTGLLDYMSHELVHQQYPLNNPLNGQKYTIDLKSYNQDCAGMLVYVTKQNPSADSLETTFDIANIEFLDSQNNSMINNIIIDKNLNRQAHIDIFKMNPWFHANIDKYFIVPFVLDLQKTISDNQVAGAGFKHQGQDYKLRIETEDDVNYNCFVNVVFISFSFLRISNGTWNFIKAE